jgi:hypothetical protein
MLEFRNLSSEYRIGMYMRGGRPITVNLGPGDHVTILSDYMKSWKSSVKAEVAEYVEKGLLRVYDVTGAIALTPAQIIAYV